MESIENRTLKDITDEAIDVKAKKGLCVDRDLVDNKEKACICYECLVKYPERRIRFSTYPAVIEFMARLNKPVKDDKAKPILPNLLPVRAVNEILKVLKFGADKYAPFNWLKGKGMPYSQLYNAMERHKILWVLGEDIDKESGLLHLAHMATGSIFLLTYALLGLGIDDREEIAGAPHNPEVK